MHSLRNLSKQPYGSNYLRNLSTSWMLLAGTFDEQELEMARSNKQQTSRTTENPKLETLSEEAADPDAYDETKAEASKRIDALKQELGLE